MFQPMRLASCLWLAIILVSCDHIPFLHPKDKPVKDSVAVPKPLTFDQLVTQLPTMELPIQEDNLWTLPDNNKLPDIPFFRADKAGKLPGVNGYIPIIYKGVMRNVDAVQYLVVYDTTGHERSRLQLEGSGYIEKESIAYDEHYPDAFMNYNISGDSLIELICSYNFLDQGKTVTDKTANFFYRIANDGMIVQVPKDTMSLQAFADGFPLLDPPFHLVDGLRLEGLKTVSRRSPYFNFAAVAVNQAIYAYGRLELNDLPPVLLFARDTLLAVPEPDYPAVFLITYDDKGGIADKLEIYGGAGGDGEYDGIGPTTIDGEGNISMHESVQFLPPQEPGSYHVDMILQYAIQPSGKIVPAEVSLITVTSPIFTKKGLIDYVKGGAGAEDKLIYAIPSADGLKLYLRRYYENGEGLAELFTTGENGAVVDHYVLYNGLRKIPYNNACGKDQSTDEDIYIQEHQGHYTKDVIIKLPGGDLHINAAGKFVK